MKSLGKGLLCLIVLSCAIHDLSAQNSSVTIGPGDLKSSAVLWLVPSGGQGLLLPSMTTATRTGMSLNSTDEKGMMVFDNQLNKVFYWNGTAWVEASGTGGGGGSGTVTSVGLALPASVFGASTPITTAGNLTAAFISQTAGTVFAAPAGAAGVPTFRALTNTDIPDLDAGKITTGSFGVARGGTGLTTTPANGQLLIGNGTGYSLSTLTAGAGVSITNGAGALTIAASGLSNPMTTAGDMIVGGASGTPGRLAIGTGVLKSNGTTPSWGAIGLASTDVSGTLPISMGGTNATTAAGARTSLGLGSLSTLSSVTTNEITDGTIGVADLSSMGAAANQILQYNGTTWVPINTPSGSGGLSNPMTTAGDMIVGGASGTPARLATGTNGQILRVNAGSPGWQNFVVTEAEIQDNTITNADISTSANIDGSKINTAFGSKNISTTGTLSSGAITATNLASINSVSYTWPAAQGAANSVLQNNGSGTLSWATVATAFSSPNAIIKGNAAGTAQVASSMTDNGSTVTADAEMNLTTGKFYRINNLKFLGGSATSSTHVGERAGNSNTGIHNTFVGFESGFSTTSGEDNLFVGRRAGYSNTTAGFNTYVGKNAGYFNTTGLNTFVGWSAGYNTAGMTQGGSTFIGANAGYSSTGSYNTFVGEQAGENNTTGEFNAFVGRLTGQTNTTGNQITLIGHGADVTAANLVNATAIGYNARVGSSSSVVLGGIGAQAVNVGIGIAKPSTDLHVVHDNGGGPASGDGFTIANNGGENQSWTFFVSNSTGNLVLMQDLNNTVIGQFDDSNGAYTAGSDQKLKKNIVSLESVLPRINAMSIRRYHYKRQKDSEPTNIGVIAQELKEVFPELVKYAPEQDTYTVDYMSMGPLAIKAIQEQQTMIEQLRNQVTELLSKLKKEENTNSELSAKLEALIDDVVAIKRSVGLDQKAENTPKK